MNHKRSKIKASVTAIPDAGHIQEKLGKLLAKVLPNQSGKVFVIKENTIILTPEIRASLVKRVESEVTSLREKIRFAFIELKKRADAGNSEAMQVLYEATTIGVIALDSIKDLKVARLVAQSKSLWPVMGSSEDSVVGRNAELFKKIELGTKITTRPVPHLLRNESAELYWAMAIYTEMNRIRDFLRSLVPETKSELFSKADLVWPCKIKNHTAWLNSEVLLECEKLPVLGGDSDSKNLWWSLLENIFEILTESKWEQVQELSKTYERAAETNSDDFAYRRNYIRANIKKNLKVKFLTRVAPPEK